MMGSLGLDLEQHASTRRGNTRSTTAPRSSNERIAGCVSTPRTSTSLIRCRGGKSQGLCPRGAGGAGEAQGKLLAGCCQYGSEAIGICLWSHLVSEREHRKQISTVMINIPYNEFAVNRTTQGGENKSGEQEGNVREHVRALFQGYFGGHTRTLRKHHPPPSGVYTAIMAKQKQWNQCARGGA